MKHTVCLTSSFILRGIRTILLDRLTLLVTSCFTRLIERCFTAYDTENKLLLRKKIFSSCTFDVAPLVKYHYSNIIIKISLI